MYRDVDKIEQIELSDQEEESKVKKSLDDFKRQHFPKQDSFKVLLEDIPEKKTPNMAKFY
jgi:23S rRNA A2030 N6-methylase RlmJ